MTRAANIIGNNDAADKPVEEPSQELVEQQGSWLMPTAMQQRLRQAGFDPTEVTESFAPMYWKVEWENLCTLRTQDPKTLSSPVCVVTGVTEFPEDDGSFGDYIGYIRIEFFNEDGEPQAVTHARCYRTDGSYTPLTEWVRKQIIPFRLRFGYVSTRKEGRHIVRPLPVNIKVV